MDPARPSRFVIGYRIRSRSGEEVPVRVVLDEGGVHVRQESIEEDVAWEDLCAAGETADSAAGNRNLCLLHKQTLRRILVPCSEEEFPDLREFVAARVPFVQAVATGAHARMVGGDSIVRTAGGAGGAGDLLLRERKRQLDERLSELPLLPAAYHDAEQVAGNPLASVIDFERVIARSRSLAERVLKLANSPRYARARKLTKLSECLPVLGFSAVRDIVLGFTLSRTLPKDVSGYGMPDYGAWRHGMAVGLAARTLERRLRAAQEAAAAAAETGAPFASEAPAAPRETPGELFLALLVHDVGKVVLAPLAQERRAALLEELGRCQGDLPQAEQNVLGFDHQEIGVRIVRRWGLSRLAQEVVLHHHLPSEAVAYRWSVALAHVADHLVHRLGIAETQHRSLKSRLDRAGLDILGLSAEQLVEAEGWIAEEEVTYRTMANQLA
ncbi:MAG: HDOD domain-containing protein [Planctomycetes bacterium]|nr:HDOD domain-containing protein [Planctomycetota bacterium]